MAEDPKVLLIDNDDDEIVRLHNIVGAHGYDFGLITKPEGLVGNVLNLAPSIIIVKLEMPGLDGFAISKDIRSHPRLKNIPIVLTSDTQKTVDMEQAASCGIDAFIPKPVPESKLLGAIKSLISKGRRQPSRGPISGMWKVFLVHSNPSRGKHLVNMLDLKLRRGLLARQDKYQVITGRGNVVEEGREALVAIRKVRPDILIISDVFEGMSGWQVCEHLRRQEEFEKVQIIVLVSRKSRDIDWLRELAGANGLLYEPFHSKELVELVRKMTRALSGT